MDVSKRFYVSFLVSFFVKSLIIQYICYLDRQHLMPTIKIIDKVKIDVYAREHPPPHVHIKFAEHEELIEIESLNSIVGEMPKNQRKKALIWVKANKEYVLNVFKQLNPKL